MGSMVKIVLDADVIIHFVKGERLALLFEIFPEYEYLILDVVYEEVAKHDMTRIQVDNYLRFFPSCVSEEKFLPIGESIREFVRLQTFLGKGESACMVYCREHHEALGSSNLRDIMDYCAKHRITYLTTLDFLYYAFIRHKINREGCNEFIQKVISKGSKLPNIDITQYVCSVQM